MTAKPVQRAALEIQKHVIDWIAGADNKCGLATIQAFVQQAADAESQAALSAVRSLLEAKAKEWQSEAADMSISKPLAKYSANALIGTARTQLNGCASELLSLAATLEPGEGK